MAIRTVLQTLKKKKIFLFLLFVVLNFKTQVGLPIEGEIEFADSISCVLLSGYIDNKTNQ